MAKKRPASAKVTRETRSETIGARFTPTEYRAVAAAAEAERRPLSQFVELLVMAELERRKGRK